MDPIRITAAELESMKNTDLLSLKPDTLVDIREVTIDTNQPKLDRLRDFLIQIKNPYCFKVGDVIVKVQFANDGLSLEEKLKNYFLSL